MKLHLHIERLVVPDDVHDDPARLAAAVQQAIAAQLGPAAPPDLLAPDLAAGVALASAAPVTTPPLTRAALPHAIAGAVLSTLRGPR